MTMALLPGIDLILGIPIAIVTIMRTPPQADPVAPDQLQTAGVSLLDAVRNRVLASRAVAPWRDDEDAAGLPQRLLYTGQDAVYARLGPTWK